MVPNFVALRLVFDMDEKVGWNNEDLVVAWVDYWVGLTNVDRHQGRPRPRPCPRGCFQTYSVLVRKMLTATDLVPDPSQAKALSKSHNIKKPTGTNHTQQNDTTKEVMETIRSYLLIHLF